MKKNGVKVFNEGKISELTNTKYTKHDLIHNLFLQKCMKDLGPDILEMSARSFCYLSLLILTLCPIRCAF